MSQAEKSAQVFLRRHGIDRAIYFTRELARLAPTPGWRKHWEDTNKVLVNHAMSRTLP